MARRQAAHHEPRGPSPKSQEVDETEPVGLTETSTRFIGWCPVCQRDIKVRSGALVHHGYQRPGIGHIVGDCPGVGFEPYETGTGAADHYLNRYAIPRARSAEERLAELRSPEGPDRMWFEYYDIATRRVIYWPNTGIPKTIELNQAEADALRAQLPAWDQGHFNWERQIRIATAQTESELKFWRDEETRMSKLIQDWTPQPLRTIEQEIERQEQSKAERESARGAARDKKIADEVAKIQKRIDSAVRNKNSATLADIYSSTKLSQVSGWRLTSDQSLALLDRDHVWAAFGLLGPDGYITGEAARDILQEMHYGRRVPANRPGVRFDYGPLPWPEALGGGTSKTR